MRIRQLDGLRALAVLLVFGAHVKDSVLMRGSHGDLDGSQAGWIGQGILLWNRAGWAGVDLFFVLSGFLVSGLLFAEYQRYGQIAPGRFLIRRGFKIYPAFYVLLLFTITAKAARREVGLSKILNEIFFLQNYGAGLCLHTWSLAVEEHFYLLLVAFIYLMQKRAPRATNPFRAVPWAVLISAILALALRILTTLYVTPYAVATHHTPTHLRLDSLMFGVFIAYWYHWRQPVLAAFISRRARHILLASGALIFTCFSFEMSHPFISTIGYTLLYVGFGGILLVSLYWKPVLPAVVRAPARLVGRAAAFIGRHSYSIYLWHLAVGVVGLGLIRRLSGRPIPPFIEVGIFVVGSVAVGVLMAKLVEQPVLKLRDRLYPARGMSPTASGEKTAAPIEAIRASGLRRSPGPVIEHG
jgi:peptidoglycan/LPS O-acetylase OafA/YrhL